MMPDSAKNPAFSLFYSSLVKSLAVALGVLQVLVVCTCKVVRTAEVFLGTHIYIVVVHVV